MNNISFRADGKTFKKPRNPFEKERLDGELKLVGEFGLRNKREVWRVQMALSKIRKVRHASHDWQALRKPVLASRSSCRQ